MSTTQPTLPASPTVETSKPPEWEYYPDPGSMSYSTAKRLYNLTVQEINAKADSWTFIIMWVGPIIIAGILAFVIQTFFRQGITPLHWGYIPAVAGVGGILSHFFFKDVSKSGMWPIIFGNLTISIRDNTTATIHAKKIKSHYYRLTRYQQPDIHRGGAAKGSITIPVHLGITCYPGETTPIASIADLTWTKVQTLPAETRDNEQLARGFTTRVTKAIYGKLYAVTIHGETESGVSKMLGRNLRDLAGWLPAFLIWLAITISMFTGFSVTATIGEYVSGLPEGVRSLIETDP